MATVEVNPHKRAIIQVRAKCNRRAGFRTFDMVRQWAAQEKLQLQIRIS